MKILRELLLRYSDLLQAGWYGDRIPVNAKFYCNCLDQPCVQPSLLYNRYRVSFLEVKWLGSWRWSPCPFQRRG